MAQKMIHLLCYLFIEMADYFIPLELLKGNRP